MTMKRHHLIMNYVIQRTTSMTKTGVPPEPLHGTEEFISQNGRIFDVLLGGRLLVSPLLTEIWCGGW